VNRPRAIGRDVDPGLRLERPPEVVLGGHRAPMTPGCSPGRRHPPLYTPAPAALQSVPASEQPAILGRGRNGDDVRMSQQAAVVKDSLGPVRVSRQRAIDDPKQPLLRREVIGESHQELDGLHMRDLRSLQVQRHRTHVALDGAADLVLLLGLREAGDQDFDRPALHLARFDLRRRHDGMVAHAG
jgi:hypothetical protein